MNIGRGAWSVVVPYYNEAADIARTLDSLAAQDIGRFRLILVNNASSDTSEDICRDVMARYPHLDVTHLFEPCPGKTNALETGFAAVASEFVAFCDADSFYPPQYLRRCGEIYAADARVDAALAVDLFEDAERFASKLRRILTVSFLAPLLARQAHSGGSALSFRTDALRRAGGFSGRHWPFVLEDHEIIHRVCRAGKVRYAYGHWCRQSSRRRQRKNVNWTRLERMLYSFAPYALKDWFFYDFLAERFHARGLYQVNLRDRSGFAQSGAAELALQS